MATMRAARRSPVIAVLVVALVAMTVVFIRQQIALAGSSMPADKMTVTASNTSVTAPNATATLMTAQMKTSTPADLRLEVTAECTILSQISNTGSETQAYTAKVDVWVEVDGKPVPVVPPASTTGASGAGTPAGGDDGHVVFCNREFQRTTVFDAQNESIKDVDNTSEANGFNWVAMNVGNGIHQIVVKAHFTDTNGTDTFAHGVVGKRGLTVDTTNYFISQPSPAP
jgi:hypothetical protein